MTDETNNDISILGEAEEAAIDERNAGFLPGRNTAPEEPAVAPPPVEEPKSDLAQLAEAQEAILERLPETPDGWVDDPETHEDIRHNADLLNTALGVGQLNAADRREVLDDALSRWREDWEAPGQLARELGRIDQKVQDEFVQAWAAEEASENEASESAAEYLERESRLSRMLAAAKQAVADKEDAAEAEEKAVEAFSDGIKAFKSGLSPSDRAFEQRALEVFSATLSNPNFDTERTYSSEDVAGFLQHALGAARQLANAKASAQVAAEWDQLNPRTELRTAEMGPVDGPRPYAAHLNDEIHKRMESGELAIAPPTFPEKVAEQQDLSNPRSEAISVGWNVGEKRPSGPKAEIDADDGPNSLDTDLERARRIGWDLSQEPRKGHNQWNRASRKR